MRWGSIALFTVVAWGATPAYAQETTGIDLNSLPQPIADSSFSGLSSARGIEPNQIQSALRFTYLNQPLSLRIPSPAPEGYSASVVDGVVLAEVAVAIGTPWSLELGVGLGAHIYQWGSGMEAGSGSAATLRTFGASDPRLEFAWSGGGQSLRYRPFFILTIPLGSQNALAGEKHPRATLGSAFSGVQSYFEWSAQVALLLRDSVAISSSTWGSQLHLGGGLMVRITPKIALGPEVHALPVLKSQRAASSIQAGRSIPAETLVTFRYRAESWNLGIAAGTGLPLSKSSTVNQSTGPVRGPTSPLFRGLIDWRVLY